MLPGKLGKADFGIFNFVTTFTMLFYPIGVLGLNRLSVRDLASADNPQEYAQRMFTTRAMTAIVAAGLILGVSAFSQYPERTAHAILLATAIFMVQLITESLTDVFNAFQKMKYTALTAMVAGLALQSMSVIALSLGYGLYPLLYVYIMGQIMGLLVAVYWTYQRTFKIRLRFDWTFMRIKVVEGTQFFLMTMTWFAMTRIDTVFLSKAVSMEDLGLYTSALLLVTKLSFIPHAVSSALLPALSKAYGAGDHGEISKVSGAFVTKIILVILPCVITVSFFADTIIAIIFGGKYEGAGAILKIGIWAFLFSCIAFCEFSILTAVRKQNLLLRAYLISGAYCLMANFFLIRFFKMQGAVIAFTTTQALLFFLFTVYASKAVKNFFDWGNLSKIFVLNTGLCMVFKSLSDLAPWWFSIACGSVLYIAGMGAFKLVNLKDLKTLKEILRPA